MSKTKDKISLLKSFFKEAKISSIFDNSKKASPNCCLEIHKKNMNYVFSDKSAVKKSNIFLCGSDFVEEFNQNTKKEIENFVLVKSKEIEDGVVKFKDLKSKKTCQKIIIVYNTHCEHLNIVDAIFSKIPKKIIGITGTNGKTSSCFFTAQILSQMGSPSCCIGTLGIYIFKDGKISTMESPQKLTNLFWYEIRFVLNEVCKKYRCFSACIEISSHGLDQNRNKFLKFDIVGWTYLGMDHLDYHKTMENYFNTKLKIFDLLKKDGLAVVGKECKKFQDVRSLCVNRGINVISFGTKESSVYFNQSTKEFIVNSAKLKNFNFDTKITIRRKNIECALACCSIIDQDSLVRNIKNVRLIDPPGRMDQINHKESVVFIDYAHTPDSLEEVSKIISNSFKGYKKIIVFGCGGDRDVRKRPIMGEIGGKYFDVVIVTDDTIRKEDPNQVRQSVMLGAEKYSDEKIVKNISGRVNAIKEALFYAKKKSVVLIAGMGIDAYPDQDKNNTTDKDQIEICLGLKSKKIK